MVLGISGCASVPSSGTKLFPEIEETQLSSIQPIATVTITAIPTRMATSTTRPTATMTPIPTWITEYADPILKVIANRSPTYQDDFSNPHSGWFNGLLSFPSDHSEGGCKLEGDKRYWHGEYLISAESATSTDPVMCTGNYDYNIGSFADFVVEFDVRIISGDAGEWQFYFHGNNYKGYSLVFPRKGNINLLKFGPDTECCSSIKETRLVASIKPIEQWNHFQLIVRTSKIAIYINGTPFLYAEDNNSTKEYINGYFGLDVFNYGKVPMETRWDNFRVWNITNLP